MAVVDSQGSSGPTVNCDCSINRLSSPQTTPLVSLPSRSLQNPNPDQDFLGRGCICGSITLPLFTVPCATGESQSCAYTEMPFASASNPISIESQYCTINCQACTLIGGIANFLTCTSVVGCTPTATPTPATVNPTPTFAVFLTNNSTSIGDENNKNNGSDLCTTLYSKRQCM